jgi:hypothetical protein
LKDDAEDEVVLWPLAGDLPVLAFFGVRGPGELTPRGELREGEVVRCCFLEGMITESAVCANTNNQSCTDFSRSAHFDQSKIQFFNFSR